MGREPHAAGAGMSDHDESTTKPGPRRKGRRRRSSDAKPSSGANVADLERYLSGPNLPEDALSFQGVRGLLFAIASTPERVLPSEWIPLAFGGEVPRFESMAQGRRVLGGLMVLYNEINAEVLEGRVRLPEGCEFREDVLANLSDDAPVSQWSRGFIRGHCWLEETWEDHLPEELSEDLGAMMLALSFFASREIAERCLAECSEEENSLEEMAKTLAKVFPQAMTGYAHLGRSIQRVVTERGRAERSRVGRNDPCACGSGKNHEKCCGAADA